MKIDAKNKSAFTLIEIVIAMAIFASALVLTTGIFSSILGNQTLISASSAANGEGQRIMKQITDDMIDANRIGSVKKISGSYYSRDVEGFLFLDENLQIKDPATLSKFIADDDIGKIGAEEMSRSDVAFGLALFSAKGIKIYHFKRSVSNKQVGDIEYAFIPGTAQLEVDNSNKINMTLSFTKLNSGKVEADAMIFWGSSCYRPDCNYVPFVQSYLITQTKNYDQTSPNKRSAFSLENRISKRSYVN